MGRKSKLTKSVQDRVILALKGGNYFNTACRYAGISPATGYDWMARGESESPRRCKSAMYVAFAEAVRAAEAETEVRMVAQWQQKMPDDWRAIQTFLERRYPADWGRKEQHMGEGGGPIQHGFAISHLVDLAGQTPGFVAGNGHNAAKALEGKVSGSHHDQTQNGDE